MVCIRLGPHSKPGNRPSPLNRCCILAQMRMGSALWRWRKTHRSLRRSQSTLGPIDCDSTCNCPTGCELLWTVATRIIWISIFCIHNKMRPIKKYLTGMISCTSKTIATIFATISSTDKMIKYFSVFAVLRGAGHCIEVSSNSKSSMNPSTSLE